VIEKLLPAPGTYPARQDELTEPPSLPYPIPLASIQSITQVRRASSATVPLLILVGLAGALVLLGALLEGNEFSPDAPPSGADG
jgi:hypothetical protein